MILKPGLKFVALARKKTERYVVPTDGSHLCPRHPVSGPSNSWHCTCLGHSTTTYFTSLTFVVWTALVPISTSADLKLASEYTYHTKLQPKRATPLAHYHRDQRVHDVIHPFVLDEGSKACPYGNQALGFSSGGISVLDDMKWWPWFSCYLDQAILCYYTWRVISRSLAIKVRTDGCYKTPSKWCIKDHRTKSNQLVTVVLTGIVPSSDHSEAISHIVHYQSTFFRSDSAQKLHREPPKPSYRSPGHTSGFECTRLGAWRHGDSRSITTGFHLIEEIIHDVSWYQKTSLIYTHMITIMQQCKVLVVDKESVVAKSKPPNPIVLFFVLLAPSTVYYLLGQR